MDVRARLDPDPVDTRCPYCHDLLAVDAAQVECGGCGTRHHAGCLEELGRCTVLGCAWTTDGRAPPPITARPTELLRRQVAERVRSRGAAYRAARDAARAAGEGPPEPPPAPMHGPVFAPPPRDHVDGDSDVEAFDAESRRVAAGIFAVLLLLSALIFALTR